MEALIRQHGSSEALPNCSLGTERMLFVSNKLSPQGSLCQVEFTEKEKATLSAEQRLAECRRWGGRDGWDSALPAPSGSGRCSPDLPAEPGARACSLHAEVPAGRGVRSPLHPSTAPPIPVSTVPLLTGWPGLAVATGGGCAQSLSLKVWHSVASKVGNCRASDN